MTKHQLIEEFAKDRNLTMKLAKTIVDTIFINMAETLERDDRVEIRGFGSFNVKFYDSYDGRNPRTGQRVKVRPKRLPFFKAGKELKERVNNGFSRKN